MNILYCDLSTTGHRPNYIRALCSFDNKNKKYILLPENDLKLEAEMLLLNSGYDKKRTLLNYIKHILLLRKIAHQKKIDIIHILSGDEYYKFGGILLWVLKKFNLIITFHHVYTYSWRKLAFKRILKRIEKGIVHTQFLKDFFYAEKINNLVHIEYPVFDFDKLQSLSTMNSKLYWNIAPDVKVIGIIGTLSRYKGIEILLNALNDIDMQFHLLVAGHPKDYAIAEIKKMTAQYEKHATLKLQFLSKDEYKKAISASDIVVLPYIKEFNGASGILADSVCLDKKIVGSNYGSLGDTISRNHIGITFQVGNIKELTTVLKISLKKDFKYDEIAVQYKKSLMTSNFTDKYKDLYRGLLEYK